MRHRGVKEDRRKDAGHPYAVGGRITKGNGSCLHQNILWGCSSLLAPQPSGSRAGPAQDNPPQLKSTAACTGQCQKLLSVQISPRDGKSGERMGPCKDKNYVGLLR